MSNLLIKPNKDSKIKFDITPETAHWDYVGFKLYHLKKGDNMYNFKFVNLSCHFFSIA